VSNKEIQVQALPKGRSLERCSQPGGWVPICVRRPKHFTAFPFWLWLHVGSGIVLELTFLRDVIRLMDYTVFAYVSWLSRCFLVFGRVALVQFYRLWAWLLLERNQHKNRWKPSKRHSKCRIESSKYSPDDLIHPRSETNKSSTSSLVVCGLRGSVQYISLLK